MPAIPDSISDMLIGAGGTAGYLYLWNAAMQRWSASAEQRRERQRRRLAQILLFVCLTPYVLLLFALMEAVRPW